MINQGFKDLIAYQKACQIFEITLKFPKEERYSLTDQIRRSSRSVCANLAEAYRKRGYYKHYLLKLSDCLGENSETLVWLDFSLHCHYFAEEDYIQLIKLNEEVGRLLSFMVNHPDKFGVTPIN